MEISIDQLRLYWVEQHKNSIISANEYKTLYISISI